MVALEIWQSWCPNTGKLENLGVGACSTQGQRWVSYRTFRYSVVPQFESAQYKVMRSNRHVCRQGGVAVWVCECASVEHKEASYDNTYTMK